MSDSAPDAANTVDPQDEAGERKPDPKEQMRAALEAKKAAAHANTSGAAGSKGKTGGGPHGQQGGKRAFRRKAGG